MYNTRRGQQGPSSLPATEPLTYWGAFYVIYE